MFQELTILKNGEANSVLMDLHYLRLHLQSHVHLQRAFKFSAKVFKKLQHQRTYTREYVPITSSWCACYATDMTVIPSHIWNPVHLTKHKLFQVPNCYPSQSLYDPFQMSFDYHVCLTLHPFKYWIFTENSSLWVILKHKCTNKIKTPN